PTRRKTTVAVFESPRHATVRAPSPLTSHRGAASATARTLAATCSGEVSTAAASTPGRRRSELMSLPSHPRLDHARWVVGIEMPVEVVGRGGGPDARAFHVLARLPAGRHDVRVHPDTDTTTPVAVIDLSACAEA